MVNADNQSPASSTAGLEAADPNVMTWADVQELGLDPAPADMASADEDLQVH